MIRYHWREWRQQTVVGVHHGLLLHGTHRGGWSHLVHSHHATDADRCRVQRVHEHKLHSVTDTHHNHTSPPPAIPCLNVINVFNVFYSCHVFTFFNAFFILSTFFIKKRSLKILSKTSRSTFETTQTNQQAISFTIIFGDDISNVVFMLRSCVCIVNLTTRLN